MLETILASVRARLPDVVSSGGTLRRAATRRTAARDFAGALGAPGLQVIAEVKRRSPSAGDISPGLDAAAQARSYVRGGAAAVSVLTESEFFAGRLTDLEQVVEAVDIPVLRKDFIIHPAQVWESRASGADAVLLIVAALDDVALSGLIAEAADVGVHALVEAHSRAEAGRALAAGAGIVGVNNRNLETFTTDLSVAEAVVDGLSPDVIKVAESGVSHPSGAVRMAEAGYDAILVGEAAVRAEDPAAFVASLLKAAR